MMFNAAVGNPPYSSLHAKFFNLAVSLTADGGMVGFIHPSTPYFSNAENRNDSTKRMIETLKSHEAEVKMFHPDVFPEARNFNDIAMTIMLKEPGGPLLKSVEYSSGRKFHGIALENVSKTEMEPGMLESIREKYKTMVRRNGSIADLITEDANSTKANLQKIRGNVPPPGKSMNHDLFTFISKDPSKRGKDGDYGVSAENEADIPRIYDYLMTKTARFGLALMKINANMGRGELSMTPIVDFGRTWTDAELGELLRLTESEMNAIDCCIPDYYD